MKVGILTLPLEDNYGGILQNWALQHTLKQLMHEPITIDYGLKYGWIRYFLSCGKTCLMRIKGVSRSFPHRPRYGRYGSKFSNNFIHKQIIKTEPVNIPTEDMLNKYGIDAIIVGSDQVWRPIYNTKIENSFIGFAPNFTGKRIAYAASFGVDNWEFSDEQTLICKELIRRFDAISVRESNGVSLCKEHFNVSAIHLLDPTLLVQRQDYFDLCKKVKPSDSFVAVYCLDMTDDKRKIIKDLALKKNLPIRLFGANKDAKLSIEQWLAMFRDAESVITDSFHGTIFSIIFQKPFYSIVNEGRGTSRFYSLLSSLGLAERMQSDSFDKGINWERVEKELNIFQKKSLDFLIYSLSK